MNNNNPRSLRSLVPGEPLFISEVEWGFNFSEERVKPVMVISNVCEREGTWSVRGVIVLNALTSCLETLRGGSTTETHLYDLEYDEAR